MTRKHWLVMISGCGLPVLFLAVALLLQVQLSSLLLFGLILVCPLVHLFLLRGHLGQGQQTPGGRHE